MARSQKLRIDGKYYYFNSDGSMARAQWVDIAGVRYRVKSLMFKNTSFFRRFRRPDWITADTPVD